MSGTRTGLFVATTVGIVAALTGGAPAGTHIWVGGYGGEWYTSGNWLPAGSPDPEDNLIVSSGRPEAHLRPVLASDGGRIEVNGAGATFNVLYVGVAGAEAELLVQGDSHVTADNLIISQRGSGPTGRGKVTFDRVAIDVDGVHSFEQTVEKHTMNGGMVILTAHQKLSFGRARTRSLSLT